MTSVWDSRIEEMKRLEQRGVTAREFAAHFGIDRNMAYTLAYRYKIQLTHKRAGYQGEGMETPPLDTGGFLVGVVDKFMIPEMEKPTGRYL